MYKKSYMYGDNEFVVNSSSCKTAQRHTALSLCHIYEAVASMYVGFYFLLGCNNPADILSKHWSYAFNWGTYKACCLKRDTSRIEKG